MSVSSDDTSHAAPRVAVIGAGISGLAAAAYLAKHLPRATIDIFESQGRIGGVIHTERFMADGAGEIQLEHAADNFASLLGHVDRLHKTLGIEPELLKPHLKYRFAQVVHRSQVTPIPLGFSMLQPSRLKPILSSPILSPLGKLRVLAEQIVPSRKSGDDESLKSFACRRLGKEAFEKLVEPIVCGIFTAKPESLSMQAALPQFVEMEAKFGSLIKAAKVARRKVSAKENMNADSAREATGARYDIFSAPRLGMSDWLQEIANALPSNVHIRLNSPVEAISQATDGKWDITAKDQRHTYDGCIVALPAPQAAKLLSSCLPAVGNELGEIHYASSAVLVIGIKAAELQEKHRCFGIVVPQVENKNILAVSFSSLKYPGRCSDDQIICRIFLGGAVRPEIFDWDDERIKATAMTDVQALLGLKSAPLWTKLVRWPNSMPQYDVGHKQRVERIEALLQGYPTIKICGNAFRGVGIPQCVFSGETAATSLAGQLALSTAIE